MHFMTDVESWLTENLHGKGSPFLFVGSGMSRRYAGIESWEGLLRSFAEHLPFKYEYYKSKSNGDLPLTASHMAGDFSELWWRSDAFESSRALLSGAMAGVSSPLKSEIAAQMGRAIAEMEPGDLAEELALLQNATVDGIITTNYDQLLENVFPEFKVFIGQRDLLFAEPMGVGEIYKIHGCASEWDTMVLTSEDYAEFERRSAYLAAKLMTIFVEHPIIFLGYSISDRNVRQILTSILDCVTADNVGDLRDRLIFIEWKPGDETRVSSEMMLLGGTMLPLTRMSVPDFVGVFRALAGLRRAFPAKLLRSLKEHVYELISSNNPHEQLAVLDIDDDVSNVDVVFGVGAAERLGGSGYVGLSRLQLLDDIVDEGASFDAHRIVHDTLPTLLRGPGFVPVFKYLRQTGYLDENGAIRSDVEVDQKIRNVARKNTESMASSEYWSKQAPQRLVGISGIADLRQKRGANAVFNLGACLDAALIDTGELRAFLKQSRNDLDSAFDRTQWGKLACLLDRLENGPPA